MRRTSRKASPISWKNAPRCSPENEFRVLRQSQIAAAETCRPSWTSTSIRTSSATTDEINQGDRWQPSRVIEELKPKARAAGSVEPVSAGERRRRRPHESGIRAAVRDHGPLGHGARSFQLLGARHGQHGSAGALWHARTKGALAQAAAGGRNPLLFCDDRAGGGLLRRHQYRGQHRARRRSLRDQRAEMVVVRRGRSALQDLHLHGQDRSLRAAPQAAVHDSGSDGRAGHHDRTHAHGLRLR